MIKIHKYHVLLAFMAFFIIGAGILIFFNFRSSLSGIGKNTEIITHDSEPEFHFILISENISDPFWSSLKKGVERASNEFDVAVEFVGPSFLDRDEEKKCFKIAVASKVDGIATHVWDEEEAQELIDQAAGKGIPVVTIDTDAGKSKRSSFIGANAYDSGLKLGRMLMQASNGKASAAVLVNSEAEDSTIQNLIISGINDGLADIGIKITIIDTIGKDYSGIEDAAGEVLTSRPDLDFIVCTTSSDTESVAQRLIDLNKVGYDVIGIGDSDTLLNYISKGVIYGTIAKNAEKMGYDSISALVELKRYGRISAYYPTEIRSITQDNVTQFLNKNTDKADTD